jgi:shikimate dehydrogenase
MADSMATPDRYVLFGHPVSHSWSPFIHGLFARQFGHTIDYKLVDVEAEDFRKAALEFFSGGGRGANVTVPHKVAAAELANELTARAKRAGAVNTLALRDGDTLLGDNTDGVGLVTDLTVNIGFVLKRRRILILGAGGSVRGVLAPLLAEHPGRVFIANRTARRAEDLVAAFEDLGPLSSGSFDETGHRPGHDLLRPGLFAPPHAVPAVGPAARREGQLPGLGDAGGTGGRVVPAVARRPPRDGARARRAGDAIGTGP